MNSTIIPTHPGNQQRARCIVEFIEGDIRQPPIIYPAGGDDEIDKAMVAAILKGWVKQ